MLVYLSVFFHPLVSMSVGEGETDCLPLETYMLAAEQIRQHDPRVRGDPWGERG